MRIKRFVVASESIKNGPHHFEALVVVQCLLGGDIARHDDGDDDVAVFLLLIGVLAESAHHTPHRLHHLHLTVAWRKEDDGIESGHIHPLAQTAHIAQHSALVGVGSLRLQPCQLLVSGSSIHRAVDVLCLDVHHMLRLLLGEVFLVVGAHLREVAGYLGG